MSLPVSEIVRRYDAGVRAKPLATPGLSLDERDGAVTLAGFFNFASWWTFGPEETANSVANMARRYRERGESLMWHVYSHDGPLNLEAELSANGFVVEQTTTFMVISVEAACRTLALRPEDDVRRAETLDALREYVTAGSLAFGGEDAWQMTAFMDRLGDPDLALFVAYDDNRPVGSGRPEADPRSSFGELFGGGVAPACRGKGLYRAMVAARAHRARDLGLEFLVTSARDTSRPILQKLGFKSASTKVCWILQA